MKPTIRELSDRTVADFGRKWFVFFKDGRIIKKITKNGLVESREITRPSIRHQVRRYCGLEARHVCS